MMPARTPEQIETAFRHACASELAALKPGNVHVHAAGHNMQISDFERALDAAASPISDPSLSIGEKILRATQASVAATGINTNLGIVLLCAPLAKAAAEVGVGLGLRRRLAVLLSELNVKDAADAFAAIRLANPAGLGSAPEGDVRGPAPSLSLIEAMHLAAGRDRIANAYVTAYADIFDFALPAYNEARHSMNGDLAVTALHMRLLAEFEDSHLSRKWGVKTAQVVQAEARALIGLCTPNITPKGFQELLKFDLSLKQRGLNPGTTADFVVATLFADGLSRQKPA